MSGRPAELAGLSLADWQQGAFHLALDHALSHALSNLAMQQFPIKAKWQYIDLLRPTTSSYRLAGSFNYLFVDAASWARYALFLSLSVPGVKEQWAECCLGTRWQKVSDSCEKNLLMTAFCCTSQCFNANHNLQWTWPLFKTIIYANMNFIYLKPCPTRKVLKLHCIFSHIRNYSVALNAFYTSHNPGVQH